LTRACETLEFDRGADSVDFTPVPRGRGARAIFSLYCPLIGEAEEILPCGGRLVLREAMGRHRVLGRGHGTSDGESTFVVRVTLTPLGRRRVLRRHGVVATAHLAVDDFPRVAWTIRLRGR
jgi:hypothetical protein